MKKTEQLGNWEETEREDRNRNGISDDIEPPAVVSSEFVAHEVKNDKQSDPVATMSGLDAEWDAMQSSGDEPGISFQAAGEQSEVDQIGQAMGVTYQSSEELKVGEKERSRDKKRWELDPASSDDYQDRLKEER